MGTELYDDLMARTGHLVPDGEDVGPVLAHLLVCEQCHEEVPIEEHGVMLGDEHWEAIAPRPGKDLFMSGLLCLDCMNERLQERLGITLAESLEHDSFIVVKGWPTERMYDLLPVDDLEFIIEDMAEPVGA